MEKNAKRVWRRMQARSIREVKAVSIPVSPDDDTRNDKRRKVSFSELSSLCKRPWQTSSPEAMHGRKSKWKRRVGQQTGGAPPKKAQSARSL